MTEVENMYRYFTSYENFQIIDWAFQQLILLTYGFASAIQPSLSNIQLLSPEVPESLMLWLATECLLSVAS